MKANRIYTFLPLLLVVCAGGLLFLAHKQLTAQDKAIDLAEKYYLSLAHSKKNEAERFITPHFPDDLEKQAAQSPAFNRYLKNFKADKANYPLNVLVFVFRHMAIHPSAPNKVTQTDNNLSFELQVGGSHPVKIQWSFENINDSLRLDHIQNLHLLFERLHCQQKEWQAANSSK